MGYIAQHCAILLCVDCCVWLCVMSSLCCVDCRVEYPKLVECFPPQHLVGCNHPRTPSTCEYSSQLDNYSHVLRTGGGVI